LTQTNQASPTFHMRNFAPSFYSNLLNIFFVVNERLVESKYQIFY